MGKNKPKRKISEVLSYKVIHWVMFALVLVNLFVVYRFERDRLPAVVREEITTVSNHVYIVTNVVYGLSDPGKVAPAPSFLSTNSLGGVRVNDPEFEIPLSYHYFTTGSKYYIQIAGFTFGVGDLTSYGRIASIFPERVLLDNGYSLKNEKFEERFGLGSEGLNFRRELANLNVVPSNSTIFVSRSHSNQNYFGGSTVSSFRLSSTNRTERIRR